MQVIWQNDDGISYKRLFATRLAKCRAISHGLPSADDRRSPSVTVKKNVPPETKLRRYRTILECTPDFASPYPGLQALTDREERRVRRIKCIAAVVPIPTLKIWNQDIDASQNRTG